MEDRAWIDDSLPGRAKSLPSSAKTKEATPVLDLT
jgi:hypothetical protein